MKIILLLSLLLPGVALAQKLGVYTSEGQRVFCDGNEGPRDVRERPLVFAGVSSRTEVQALQMRLIRSSLEEGVLKLVARLQIVSCVKRDQELQWIYETPDRFDFPEAQIPTSLFNGNLIKGEFRKVVTLGDQDRNTYYAFFSIPVSELFSRRQYHKFLAGEEARTSIELSYRFGSATSEVRPPFSINHASLSRFPVTFTLEGVFKNTEILRLVPRDFLP